jgi:hypothetical protein
MTTPTSSENQGIAVEDISGLCSLFHSSFLIDDAEKGTSYSKAVECLKELALKFPGQRVKKVQDTFILESNPPIVVARMVFVDRTIHQIGYGGSGVDGEVYFGENEDVD